MDQRGGQVRLIPLPHGRRASLGLQRDGRRGNDGDRVRVDGLGGLGGAGDGGAGFERHRCGLRRPFGGGGFFWEGGGLGGRGLQVSWTASTVMERPGQGGRGVARPKNRGVSEVATPWDMRVRRGGVFLCPLFGAPRLQYLQQVLRDFARFYAQSRPDTTVHTKNAALSASASETPRR